MLLVQTKTSRKKETKATFIQHSLHSMYLLLTSHKRAVLDGTFQTYDSQPGIKTTGVPNHKFFVYHQQTRRGCTFN
jgi:hypothetical protein